MAPSDAAPAIASAVKEKQLQSWITEALTVLGYVSYHTWLSIHSSKGFPDIVAYRVRDRRLLVMELKREGKSPTPEQQGWLEAFSAVGAAVAVVYPSTWISGQIDALLSGEIDQLEGVS